MIDEKEVALATFSLLENKQWQGLTLHNIAAHLSISLEELHHIATSKEDLLTVMISYIEAQTLPFIEENLNPKNASKEDRLFDVLFARFEAAAPHKKALKALKESFQSTPTLVFSNIPLFIDATKRLAVLGNIHFRGPLGAFQLRGFALIYARLIYVWLEDESPHMDKTMAATNKAVTKYIPCLFDPCKITDL